MTTLKVPKRLNNTLLQYETNPKLPNLIILIQSHGTVPLGVLCHISVENVIIASFVGRHIS
jgi:hypothetical protein